MSSGGYQFIDYSHPHTGSYSAWLCGYNSCSDQLWQTVTLPAGVSQATLAYYLSENTQEAVRSCNDSMAVRVRTGSGSVIATLQSVCNANSSGAWLSESLDLSSVLSSHAGQQIQVAFIATSNGTLSSEFFVDDVSLRVVAGTPVPATATPLPQSMPALVSSDPFAATVPGQHQSQVEPDTYTFGSTLVSAFQVGRYYDGGSTDVGWATYSGGSWHHGLLPGLTTNAPNPGSYDRATDPSVTYDRAHQIWMIATLAMSSTNGVAILVSQSADGLNWTQPVVAGTGPSLDKGWIACDDGTQSPYYGHCYLEWDDVSNNDLIVMSTSTNGGASWAAGLNPSGFPQGLGGQPLVQPNGTVIVPAINAYETDIIALKSTDGGQSWGGAAEVSTVAAHYIAGYLRASPLPSAEIDAAGRVYVAWQDCRFELSCSANDIVISSSADGATWSSPARVPIETAGSNVDHFIPGLAVDPSSSGFTTRLALTYYTIPTPRAPKRPASWTSDISRVPTVEPPEAAAGSWGGPMQLSWLPSTNQGSMVGDYISTSFLGVQAVTVIAIASSPTGSSYNQPMYGAIESVSGGQNVTRTLEKLSAPISRPTIGGRQRAHRTAD